MTRSLIKKKLTSQCALPYKLVRHFIIEYIYLYQKHKKTFILGTRKIVTLQEHDSTIPSISTVLGASSAEKDSEAEVTALSAHGRLA